MERKKEKWVLKYRKEIEAYLINGELDQVSFFPTKPFQYNALEEFFSHYLANYKVDQETNPIKKFVERYCISEYKKRLNDRKWSVRMNTLHFFDLVQLEGIQEDLLKRLKSRNVSNEEKYQIYILLASFGYKDLYGLFKESKGLPEFLLNVMLHRIVDENNIDEYIDMFEDLHFSWQIGILDMIRDKNLRTDKMILFLEQLIYSESVELRVRALKTISHIGYIRSASVILDWFEKSSKKEAWQSDKFIGERLIAARLMGMIKYEQFLPNLVQLISDSKYIVRTEAAKAIRKYKNGRESLWEIAANHSDGYAKQIAKEWAERSLDYD